MTGDEYLAGVIAKYRLVPNSTTANTMKNLFAPFLRQWNGNYVSDIRFSGSYAKDTAIKGEADVDLFISIEPNDPKTLKDIYDGLYSFLSQKGFSNIRKQNVSIGVAVNGTSVDLVPGKRQEGSQNYHSLFKNKTQSWTQTNVQMHVDTVRSSGRLDEIRAIKIWRTKNGLEFPSLYLELTVLNALIGRLSNQLAANVMTVLHYLRDSFANARVVDPANTANIISDDLAPTQKSMIENAARTSATRQYWSDIIS